MNIYLLNSLPKKSFDAVERDFVVLKSLSGVSLKKRNTGVNLGPPTETFLPNKCLSKLYIMKCCFAI